METLVRIFLLSVSVYVCGTYALGGQHAGCLGCQQGIDSNNREFIDAMTFAIDTVNAQARTSYRYVPVNVYNTTSQVVAGVDYRMTFDLGMTFCVNNQQTMSRLKDTCQVQPGQQTLTCRVAVWDQVWMTPRYVLSPDECTPMLIAVGK